MEQSPTVNESPEDQLKQLGKKTIGQEWWDFHNLHTRREGESVGEYTKRLRDLAIADPTHFSGRVIDVLLQQCDEKFSDSAGSRRYVELLIAVINKGNAIYLEARRAQETYKFSMEFLADIIVDEMRDPEDQNKWRGRPDDLLQIEMINTLLAHMCEHSRKSIFSSTRNQFLTALSDFSGNLTSRFKSDAPPPTQDEKEKVSKKRQEYLGLYGLDDILEGIRMKTSGNLVGATVSDTSSQPDPGRKPTEYKGHN